MAERSLTIIRSSISRSRAPHGWRSPFSAEIHFASCRGSPPIQAARHPVYRLSPPSLFVRVQSLGLNLTYEPVERKVLVGADLSRVRYGSCRRRDFNPHPALAGLGSQLSLKDHPVLPRPSSP